jgi:hypothetical protein
MLIYLIYYNLHLKVVINDMYVYLSKIYKLISKFRNNYNIILFDTIQEVQIYLLDENIKLNKCNYWIELVPQMIEHSFLLNRGLNI